MLRENGGAPRSSGDGASAATTPSCHSRAQTFGSEAAEDSRGMAPTTPGGGGGAAGAAAVTATAAGGCGEDDGGASGEEEDEDGALDPVLRFAMGGEAACRQ